MTLYEYWVCIRYFDVIGGVFISYVCEGFPDRPGVEEIRSAPKALLSFMPNSCETDGLSINTWFDPDASGGILPTEDEHCVALIARKPEETL